MKTLTAFILLGLLYSPFVTKSQDERLYAKKISPDETPEAIKEALKKDFPDAIKDIQYYMVPENMVDSEWGAAMNESVKRGDSEYYTVEMKGSGGGFVYGLYNKNGELEVMKMEANEFDLPKEIVPMQPLASTRDMRSSLKSTNATRWLTNGRTTNTCRWK